MIKSLTVSKKAEIKKMIIELLQNNDLNESQQDELVNKIELLSPDPEISDYIFWEDNLTIDEIIEKAFSYQPIILGDQSQKTD